MTAVEYTDTNKTIIALNNVFLENVTTSTTKAGDTFAKGKLVQMTGTEERQWSVLFSAWDYVQEVIEMGNNPKERYRVRGYLRNQKSKSDDKWYTNFVITNVN